jgi:hypothetical protein
MRALSALTVAALALVSAGCGDGTRLTRAEFVKQANAICARYEQRVGRLMSKVTAGDEQQLARSIGQVLPVIRRGNDELRALRPPADLQDPFDRWLEIADDEAGTAQELRVGLRSNDQTAVRHALAKLQREDGEQDEVARGRLGLAGCASGSGG